MTGFSRGARNDSISAMDDLGARTDSYFLKTKAIVGHFGDREATYAVFMRRPVISAPRFVIDFLEGMATKRGVRFEIEVNPSEGSWVGAGEPILYVTGPLFHIVDLDTVLVDYFGRETRDAVAVCRRFPELAAAWRLAFRMDTPGGRYCEGLDLARSYEVLENHAPQSIRGYRTEAELRYLVGTGVTAAALWLMRQVLDEAGFPKARIVASSGFGPAQCRRMAP